jgi:hypothetical protein
MAVGSVRAAVLLRPSLLLLLLLLLLLCPTAPNTARQPATSAGALPLHGERAASSTVCPAWFAARKRSLFLSAFPMLVPSLSW